MASPDDTARRVLIVDDDEDQRDLYEMVLEPAGYTVTTARNGLEALASIRQRAPDVVVTDIVMPMMDGLELLERIRAEIAPPPPVIVCSGFDITEQEAMRRGATVFLSKPVRAEDLRGAVRRTLVGASCEQLQEEGHERATGRRRRAIEAGAAAMRDVPLDQVREVVPAAVGVYPGYFEVAGAFGALLQGVELVTVGGAGAHVPAAGERAATRFPACLEILATGSSLLVHDASAHPSYAGHRNELGGMRFFAGVPLVDGDRIPVGTLCLVHPDPHAFAAEDLAILEAVGRRGSQLLALTQRGRALELIRPGLAGRALLEPTIDLELQIAGRDRCTSALAVVATETRDEFERVIEALSEALTPPRRLLGWLSNRRAVVFKRGVPEEVDAELARALAQVRRHARATGVVVLDDVGTKLLDAVRLFDIADRALAASELSGEVERFVVTRPQP